MASNKAKVVIDVDAGKISFAGKEVDSLKTKVRLLTQELTKTKSGTKEYSLLIKELNDTKDAMDRVKTASGEVYGTLGLLPGTIGDIAGQTNMWVDSLKILGSFKTSELKEQFLTLGTDIKEAGQGLLNFIGFQKLADGIQAKLTGTTEAATVAQAENTAVTEANAGATEAKVVATEAATVATEAETAATAESTVAAGAFATALAAIPFVAIGIAIIAIVANWEKITDAISGATDESKAYEEAQAEVTKQVADFDGKLINVTASLNAAKAGTMSKKQALKEYNDTLGDSLGYAKNLDEAEKLMAKNAPLYIQILAKKAEANILVAKAAEASAKISSGEALDLSWWQASKAALLSGGDIFTVFAKRAEYASENVTELADKSKHLQDTAMKVFADVNKLQTDLNKNKINKNPEEEKKEIDALKARLDAQITLQLQSGKISEDLTKKLIAKRVELEGMAVDGVKKSDEELKLINKGYTDRLRDGLIAQEARVSKGIELDKQLAQAGKVRQFDELEALKKDSTERDKKYADDKKVLDDKLALYKNEPIKYAETLNELKSLEIAYKNDKAKIEEQIISEDKKRGEDNKKTNLDITDKYYTDEINKIKTAAAERGHFLIDDQQKIAQFEQERAAAKLYEVEKNIKDQKALLAGQLKNGLITTDGYNKAIEQIDKDHQDELLNAQKTYDDASVNLEIETGNTKIATREQYWNRIFAIDQSALNTAQAQGKAGFKEERKLLDDWYAEEKEKHKDQKDYLIALEKEYNAKVSELNKRKFETTLQYISKGFDAAKGVADAMLAINEADQQEELEQAKATTSNKEELAKKQDEINRKYFEKNKGAQKAQAYIATFQGAVQAYTSLSGIPFVGPVLGAIAAAAAIVAGLANVRKIEATTYESTISAGSAPAAATGSKYAQGGVLDGPSHAQGGVPTKFGELEGGEYVINRRATASFLPLLAAINSSGNTNTNKGGNGSAMDAIQSMMMNQQQPIVKTYVVASDIYSQAQADKKISDLARL
jgi:hypothetical protein